jgi:hypothetical protein
VDRLGDRLSPARFLVWLGVDEWREQKKSSSVASNSVRSPISSSGVEDSISSDCRANCSVSASMTTAVIVRGVMGNGWIGAPSSAVRWV